MSGTQQYNNQPAGQRNNTHIWAEGVRGGIRGSRRGKSRWPRRRRRRREFLRLLFFGEGDEGGKGALASSSPILGDDTIDPDPEGRILRRERRRMGGGGNRDADDEEETNAAWSIISFSSKKETKEPWPAPLLYL